MLRVTPKRKTGRFALSAVSRPEEEKIVEKGLTDISMETLRTALLTLKDSWNVRLDALANDKEAFAQYSNIRRYYGRGYADTERYTKFYAMAEEIFGEFKTRLIPGTVAAYIIGCSGKTGAVDGLKNGCYPTCISSLKTPEDSDPCDSKVVVATFDATGNYLFNISTTNLPSTNAIIWVDGPFNGFTAEEKKTLSENNIDSVVVMTSDKGVPNKVLQLTPLNNVAIRQPSVVPVPSTSPQKNNIAVIIILIILILVIIYIAYQMYKNK